MGRRLLVLFTDLPPAWEYAPVSRLIYLARIAKGVGLEVEVIGSHSKNPVEGESFNVRALPVSAKGKQQAFFPFHTACARGPGACGWYIGAGVLDWILFAVCCVDPEKAPSYARFSWQHLA